MNIINDMLVDKCFPDNVNARAVVPAYKDKTASGNPITLKDSAENKPLGMKLYGWSKQDGTPSPENPVEIESAGMKWSTGKNLINADDYYSAYKQADGTYKSKTVTLNDIRISLSEFVGKEITISVKLTVGANVSGVFLMYISSEQKKINGSVIRSGLTGKSILKITPVSNTDYFVISFGSGNDDVIFSELQLELGSVATSYEPYTGGVPALYQKDIEVGVTGKNLFGGKAFADKIVEIGGSLDETNKTVTINANLINSKIIYEFPDKTKQYTIMLSGYNTQETQSPNISIVYSDGTESVITNFEKNKLIVITRKDKEAVSLSGIWVTGISTFYYEQCGVFEGVLTKTDFKPYEYQSLPISTQTGLHAIPVPSSTSGITYTDADGQAWIADEIDFARGKYIQRVWQAEFDGSEKRWVLYKNVQYLGFSIKVLPHEKMMRRYGLCTQYKTENLITSNEAIWIGVNDDVLYVKNSRFYDASLDDRGLSNFKAHLAANPLVVMTYLDTPIERDLTSAELEEYIQLYSYKQTTVVENDSDCWMDVTYKAGTSGKSKNEALKWYFKNVMPLVG